MSPNRMSSEDDAGQIMGQALAEHARRHTYCLIVEGASTTVGTAVAIQLGQRYFLATAAHVIQGSDHMIKALVRNRTVPHVAHFDAMHCDQQSDMGLLEISPLHSSHFTFLTRDRLCERMVNRDYPPTMVVGFPVQFNHTLPPVGIGRDAVLQLIICNSLTYHTQILPSSDWPNEGLPDENGILQPLIEERDMLIDFEPGQEVRPFTPQSAGRLNATVECPTLDPHGMSGGGIWLAQVRMSTHNVSYPDAPLIGLQVGWHQTKNWLHGIHIGAWLDLVREEYPDLKDAL